MDINNYTIDEHAHRFAVWTAARAASRSRLKNTEVEHLINESDLRNAIDKLRQQPLLTEAEYRQWIKEIGSKICTLVIEKNWSVFKTENFHFGLAAKIISIYIKTVEVLPKVGTSTLACIAYPPIDGILLKNINKKHHVHLKTNWSTFDWDQYEHVINTLNELYPSVPKWKIETEWCVSVDEEEL